MTDFVCVKCGSDNIQIVRGVFESGTEAKYKQREDLTKTPTIGEVLALDEEKIIITFQSRIAEKLGNIKLKKYMDTKLHKISSKVEDFLEAPETYKKIKNKLNIKKNELIELRKKEPNMPKKTDFLDWEIISCFILSFLSLLIAVYSSEYVILFVLISISLLSIVLYRIWKLITENKKKQKYLERIKTIEIEIKQLVSEAEKMKNKASANQKYFNNNLKPKIQEKNQKIKEETQKDNQQIDQQNQEKIKIWSNLYYCHRCDTVMDLDSGFHEQPENINELVEKLYQNQNLS